MKVYDGVIELLIKLKKMGIQRALVSSADRVKIQINLKVAHIQEDLFSLIVSGEDVKQKKPAPDIYLQASQKLNIPPAHCIVVEDALNGIKAAKAGGMKCIAVASTFDHQTLRKEQPDFICRQIAEVGEIINQLFVKI